MTIDVEQSSEEAARTVAKTLRLNDPEFRQGHEYEVYRLLQEHLPAAYLEQEEGGRWLFTRFDTCRQIMQDFEHFSNDTGRAVPVRWIPQTMDPPEQREYRKILEPIFSPQEMGELEPDIERYANELADTMLAKREFDFMQEFAIPFPTIIFCRLMGFPLEDHAKLMRWVGIILHGASTVVLAQEGIPLLPDGKPDFAAAGALRQQIGGQVMAYIDELVNARRADPRNDLISKLITAKYEGARPLDHDEIKNICFLFFMAGLDTVTGALGLITETFATHSAERHKFREVMHDPQGVALAVEELIRYHSTVNVPRRATQTCPVAHGVTVKEDEELVVGLVAANRDPRVFDDPDSLVLDRHPNPHLGFAVGVHRCLGIHLARRELRIGLKVLHERIPDYHVTPGKQPQLFTDGLRGLAHLPLTIGPD